jgi:hypothetical protein
MTRSTARPAAPGAPLSGHNAGPPLDEGLSLAEAQALPKVQLRPSHVQRHCGPGSPLRPIVGVGEHGWVLLGCGHWRQIRDWGITPPAERPRQSRCGCCRLGYQAHPADKRTAEAWAG